ncbi:DUF7296 family protein [Terrisporobacter sp.]|uniref:DUF7296 family protein n=1 Tax=Terrisporobacter sp. TaxID=1965305 RepID=UPI00289FDF8D|nr:hypothetical protein [Terrisporobacter sp.]
MFYTYRQNNSGGYFIQNDEVDMFVIVEGDNHQDIQKIADRIFENHSEYCTCCGERWSDCDEDWSELTNEPMINSTSVYEVEDYWYKGYNAIIYYKNGEKETVELCKKLLHEEMLNRGKDSLYIEIEDDRFYFVDGLDRFIAPEGVVFWEESDKCSADHKGVDTIVVYGKSYIRFKKHGIVSSRIDKLEGSKNIYDKCLLFSDLADILLKRMKPSGIELDEDVLNYCMNNNVGCRVVSNNDVEIYFK